ncbi:unnamed protein product [Heterobilharzia americana]|nr:unnamed protein product [Heterobilharzia americana]
MIVGWSSGAVRLYYWEPEPNTDAGRDDIIVQTKPCITHINTFWSHSIEHTENGVGEAGGTLCVAGSFCIAVSGGGNCESWFYIVNTDSDIPKVESICFRHHSAQVSAIAISDSYVATGSKDKNIVIYEYSIQTRSVTLKYILRRAADDWITSLVWSLYPADSRPANASLFVGSNDELIRRYSISENDYKLQQVLVSHKAGSNRLHLVTLIYFLVQLMVIQMNISVGSNTNETVIAPPNLVKIESFIPKHCNSECRKTLAFDFDNRSDCSPMIDGIYEAHPTSEMEVDDLSSYPLHRDDTVDCDLNDNNKVQELRIFDRSKSLPPHDNKNVRLLIGQTISLSAGSHRFQGFRFRVYKPSVLGYHATLSGHAGLAPCVITCASSPNSHEDALLVSVAGQGGDANTIGCDIRLWNLPLPDTSSLHYPIQHTGSVTCADHLKVTKNVNICISGSTGENFTSTISTHEFYFMETSRRLTSSYERPNYPINSIVTQIWRNYDDTNEYSIHYFIYIACGYELWILHIELNNENDIENTFMELFTEKGRLHVILSELAEAWATKKIAGCAKIKKYQLNRVVVQMSAIHQEPTTISQCGVVILLSNGEVIMLPYMSKDDKFVRIRIQNDLFPSSHWCTSIHSFTNGILVAHEGSVLFHLYGDPKCVLQPLRGCMNNLENLYVDTIEPLCLPFRNSLLSFKIVTSKMKSEPRIVILNNDDEMIVNIMLADLNISVTAYCLTSAHVDSQTSLTVYLLLATSDSVLRLLKCSSNDYNQTGLGEWEQ